jgi:hypothetical protein
MSAHPSLSGILEPLGDCLDAESARRLLALRTDPAISDRVAELARHANEGTISEDDQAEYDSIINAMDFISILKLKARRRLNLTASA